MKTKLIKTNVFLTMPVLLLAIMALPLQVLAQNAQQTQVQFFSMMSDVPVMNGLIEDETSTVIFDKPEGRIIEVYALMSNVTNEDVTVFYSATLPQFGWGIVKERLYFRNGEYLSLSFEESSTQKVTKFMIRPSL